MHQNPLNFFPHWFWNIYGFLFLLDVILILVALLLVILLPQSFHKIKTVIMLLPFCIFIPIIGPILFIIYILFLYFCFKYITPRKYFRYQNYPEFDTEVDRNLVQHGEGGVLVRLRNAALSAQSKLRSLVALNASSLPVTNMINIDMLQNSSDELRLFAYGMMSKQETEIYNEIHSMEKKLFLAVSKTAEFIIHKDISYCYWSLLYLNLAQDDIKGFAIKKLQEHLLCASKIKADDIAIIILQARLSLLLLDNHAAEKYFTQALELGAPENKVASYLAEISFRRKDFIAVRAIFQKHQSLRFIPKLHAAAAYWSEHE
jgi:hypothetical protein